MKRFFVLTFGFFTLLAAALLFAGPESLPSGKEMKQVAPPAPELCNWTGFYLGGNLGYAFEGRANLDLDLGGEWLVFSPPRDADFAMPLGSRDLNASGVVAGGFLGYNYQWHSVLLGIEAGVDYVDLSDSFDSGIIGVASGDHLQVRQSYKTDYRGTIGPRLGYTWNRLLFYATGGLAIGDFKFSQQINEPEPGNPFTEGGSTDDTQVGWMAGGGVEYCIAQHWSARVEYRYTDLGCVDFSTVGSMSEGHFTGHHEACLTYHSVTAGIAFKF